MINSTHVFVYSLWICDKLVAGLIRVSWIIRVPREMGLR